MTVLLLLVAGAFFALLLIVNNLLRAVQRREKISLLETLLAFLALILPLLALVQNHAAEQPLRLVNTLTIGAALVVIAASVVTLLIERRQPTRRLNQMRGVLGVGVGLLLIAATFFVPVASSLVTLPPLAAGTAAVDSNDSTNDVINVINTGATNTQNQARVAPTNTPNVALLQLSATPTRLPSVTPTPTHTPFVIASATPGATLDTAETEDEAETIQSSSCSAVVRMNLNLRSAPGSDNELLLTIPYNTALTLSRQHEDSNWWQVNYGGKTGWVNGDYLAFNGDCPGQPVPAVAPTLTPAPACFDCDDGEEASRINPGATEAAIYCLASGVKIVDLDIRGASTDSFIVPYADIMAVGVPAENTLIREYRGFRLYRLTTGEWQVNAPPNWHGAGEYVLIWDGCDQAAAP